jgi:hypothetical protein
MPTPTKQPVDLVRFLYVLLRDHVPLGRLNEALAEAPTTRTSNPHLEACARDLAAELLGTAPPVVVAAGEDLPPDPAELDDEGVPYGALCMTCGHTNGEHSAGGRCLFPTGDLRTQAEHDNACDCPALVLSPAMQVNHQARRARRGRLDPRVRGV